MKSSDLSAQAQRPSHAIPPVVAPIILPAVPPGFVEGTIGRLHTQHKRHRNGGLAMVFSVSRTMVCFVVPNYRAAYGEDVLMELHITWGSFDPQGNGFAFTVRPVPDSPSVPEALERFLASVIAHEFKTRRWSNAPHQMTEYLRLCFARINACGSGELFRAALERLHPMGGGDVSEVRGSASREQELGKVLSSFLRLSASAPRRRVKALLFGGHLRGQVLYDACLFNADRLTFKDTCLLLERLFPNTENRSAADLLGLASRPDLELIHWFQASMLVLARRFEALDDLERAAIPTVIAKAMTREAWMDFKGAKEIARAFGYRKPGTFWKKEVAPLVPTDA